ncbi:unnamed protein product [Urochloa humidicola]
MELKLTASMYYSRAPAVGGALLLAALVLALASSSMPSATAQSANGVMATYVAYDAPSVNWELGAVSASCAALDEDMPFKWRSYYWWAAFCGPAAGPRGDDACGLCVRVTNAATGTTATVRVVDDCGKANGGAVLGIDTAGFQEIDTDGRGMTNGQLEVNYQFVDCAVVNT